MRRAILALALAAASCAGEAPKPAPSARPNLVLITLDTTRADHLGCYGDARAATPNLDRIAHEGVLFTQSIAVAPLTLPSHASILTGLYPPRHGARDNADFRLPDTEATLAEHLKAQGYATAAAVGTYILARESGLSQGFERYDEPRRPPRAAGDASSIRYEPIVERKASEVVADAVASIERMRAKPFFLWVHVYDPHEPYAPPAEFRERFAGDLYDGEIAAVDAALGGLFDALRRDGLLDRTLVAVTADHGESLGEHGEDTHGLFVYDSTLRVPLILRYPPALHAGTTYPGLASGVDLAPTLLELMGLPPMQNAEGRSVAKGLTGGSLGEREPVYAESLYGERAYGWAPLHALRSATTKYIDAPERELYDVEHDPREADNLAARQDTKSWAVRLDDARKAMGPSDPAAIAAMPGEQRDRIASLGYVSAGGPGLSRKDRPDPKRLVVVSNLYQKAQQAIGAGQDSVAERLLREALTKDPGNPAAASLLGALRFSQNDRSGGLAQLRAAAAASPGNFEYQWNLGNALFVERRYDEAAKAFRAAIGIRPALGDAHYALGNVLAAQGDTAGAMTEYESAMKRGLNTPPVLAALGTMQLASGDDAGAEKSLRAAVTADPGFADGWNQLGILLDRTRRRPEAIDAFSKALDAQPDHADALFNRARIEVLAKDLPAARKDVERLLRAHPDNPQGRFLEANLCVAEGNPGGAKTALTRFLAMRGIDPRMKTAAEGMLARLGG